MGLSWQKFREEGIDLVKNISTAKRAKKTLMLWYAICMPVSVGVSDISLILITKTVLKAAHVQRL